MTTPNGKLGGFLRDVRVLMAVRGAGAVPEAELLHRYTACSDEGAFAALVERHGPMVLAICRRILRHTQDAEDAFQATFLVLARKAGAIRKHESVGGWLHSVAFRVAHKLRANQMRRKHHETAPTNIEPPVSADDLSWREVQVVVGEELNRLAAKHRSPLVLCYLEGKSRDEAAEQLGLTLSVFRGRLERAREALRARLKRRGLSLSAALLAVGVAETGRAAVPAALLSSTVQAASSAAPLTAAAGATPQAAALAQGVLNAMLASKAKFAAVAVLSLTLLGTGAGVVTYRTFAGDGPGGGGGGIAPPQLPAAPQRDDMDPVKLKREIERLRLELEATKLDLQRAQVEIRKLRYQAEISKAQNVPSGGGSGPNPLQQDPAPKAGAKQPPKAGQSPGGGGAGALPKGGQQPPKTDNQGPIAFSPDGRLLATTNAQGVTLIDAQTGKVLSKSVGHKDTVRAVAFSPDGKLVASGGNDKAVILWVAPTGQQVLKLITTDAVEALIFSADGKTLLIRGRDRTEREFDLQTGKELRVTKPKESK